MYAIVEIAGFQYRVEESQQLLVNRLPVKEGENMSFDKVLLLDNDGDVNIGEPVLEGANVEIKVIKHLKGDKVIVFKKKRRKGYRKKNGHRQSFSKIEISSILASGAKTKTKKAESKPTRVEEAVKGEASPKVEVKPKVATETKSTLKIDDLKKIEGIGPKIKDTLAEAGVVSFSDLSKLTSEKISELIAGVRGNHVTDTWPQQAKLAAEGKWDELKKWRDELDGGKA